MFFSFAIEILNYAVVTRNIFNDPSWTTQITEKCGAAEMDNAFQTNSMIANGDIALQFGAFFGIVFEAYKWPGMHDAKLIDESGWKKYARFGMALLLCIPSTLLVLLGPDQIKNIYCLMLISSFLPNFMAGFILFGIADQVNVICKLLKFEKTENDDNQ